jgi:AAA-like domain
MAWEKFVTDWATTPQKETVKGLILSEALSDLEIRVILGTCSQPYKDELARDIYKEFFEEEYELRRCYTRIYEKCGLTGKGSKKKLLDGLSNEFMRRSQPVASIGSSDNNLPNTENKITTEEMGLEFPEGVMPLNSRFYMSCDRELKESIGAISQSKGFVRIKSPRQMGKTSLLERILADSRQKGLRTAKVDLRAIDEKSLENLNCFLKWFCQQLASKLKLSIRVSEEWDDDDAANNNCSDFFVNYLLDIDYPPLLLSIDNLDIIFDYPNIADEFLGLLRTWLEDQNQSWGNMRMIIVHTWHYKTKKVNRSPLNIGKEIKLPSLTFSEIQKLVDLHELNWNEQDINTLTNLVGYHPYLIRLALYAVAQDNIDLPILLANVLTNEGIYSKYLERHYDYLTSDRALADLMAQVVKSDLPLEVKSIEIDSSSSTKLQELGLVEYSNSMLVPKNQLFKLYFADRL